MMMMGSDERGEVDVGLETRFEESLEVGRE